MFNEDKSKVLVVSSEARPECWVLPKGGAEIDETLQESAEREIWEESGAIVSIGPLIGTFFDSRPPKHWKDKTPPPARSVFYVYEASLKSLEDKWPESKTRRRTWMNYEQAVAAMLEHDRVPLAQAIEASSMKR